MPIPSIHFLMHFQFYPSVIPIAGEPLSFTALFLFSSSSEIDFTDLHSYDNDFNLRMF